ncbi:MAG: FAD-dependent thymidylate synthase [Bacillota bacterium]
MGVRFDDAGPDVKTPTIYREPRVYLIGKPLIDEFGLDAFLADQNVQNWETDTDIAGEQLAEIAGRLCYMSYSKPRPGGNAEYLHHIIEVGHGSVLEHACFNFIITQVSRSFTHELVRHRLASYSQLSQRYVDERDCAFIMPEEIAADAELEDSFRHYVREARDTYQYWSDVLTQNVKNKYPRLSATDQRKIARQTARACLPNCTETKIFVSMNARALRHFFVMRGSLAADAEMRRVALMVFSILKVEAPALFEDFEVRTDPEGRQYLHTQFVKV